MHTSQSLKANAISATPHEAKSPTPIPKLVESTLSNKRQQFFLYVLEDGISTKLMLLSMDV
jgi:hypothetical protein